MINEPICFTNKCIHYAGVLKKQRAEEDEKNWCIYYEDGIPIKISYENAKCKYFQKERM